MCYILPKFQVSVRWRTGCRHGFVCPTGPGRFPAKSSRGMSSPEQKDVRPLQAYLFETVFCDHMGHRGKAMHKLHRDFISGGGFTEPSLFVAGLLQDKDFLSPICAGPVFSRARKKPKRKAKPKRSERTRAMLAPPESSQPCAGYECGPLNEMKVVEDMTEFLPGLPASSKASWLKILFPVSSSKISI